MPCISLEFSAKLGVQPEHPEMGKHEVVGIKGNGRKRCTVEILLILGANIREE